MWHTVDCINICPFDLLNFWTSLTHTVLCEIRWTKTRPKYLIPDSFPQNPQASTCIYYHYVFTAAFFYPKRLACEWESNLCTEQSSCRLKGLVMCLKKVMEFELITFWSVGQIICDLFCWERWLFYNSICFSNSDREKKWCISCLWFKVKLHSETRQTWLYWNICDVTSRVFFPPFFFLNLIS